MKTFILGEDGKTPVEADQATFAEWMSAREKFPCVADAEVWPGVRVLTQFVGTDPHGGDKYLFETVVTGGDYDGYTQRYDEWENAHRGHFKTFERVKRWVCEGETPSDFIQDITAGLLVRWGFTPTDEGSEYERDLRGADEVPGYDGLNLVVRPDDGAVCLQEFDMHGHSLCTVALPPRKTLGGVMRIVQALRPEE